ncbi:MAG: flagellar basal body P-ring formation protein FlgA [Candidatus Accumulibacter sp.]|jgi:flagella basal body P-ring formation protein FlgA|nr:flagellar basal body P-ring formation protein FlgA [Accumulibacter sp.]
MFRSVSDGFFSKAKRRSFSAERLILLFCAVLFAAPWRLAMAAPAPAATAALYRVVEDFLRTQTQGLPGKVSYHITPLDTRTRLARCDAYEPFQPAGAASWGKTTVGVRCLGPASWTLYVQVRIGVETPYLVAARPLMAGQIIGESDFVVRNGDLGTLPASVLVDAGQALGRTVRFGVAAGQPLRGDQLIVPWAVRQGQTVKTISRGAGFSVSNEGRALNNAQEGQVVQVKTPTGQTVSGIARTGGVVEISY